MTLSPGHAPASSSIRREVWDVQNVGDLCQERAGAERTSHWFGWSGCRWQLQLSRQQQGSTITVTVRYQPKEQQTCQAYISMSVMNKRQQGAQIQQQMPLHLFTAEQPEAVCQHFLDLAAVQQPMSQYVFNDAMTVVAEFSNSPMQPQQFSTCSGQMVPSPFASMFGECLSRFMCGEAFAELRLTTCDAMDSSQQHQQQQPPLCHTARLERVSQVLSNTLAPHLKLLTARPAGYGELQPLVGLDTSHAALTAFHQLLYEQQVELHVQLVPELFQLAVQYGMPELELWTLQHAQQHEVLLDGSIVRGSGRVKIKEAQLPTTQPMQRSSSLGIGTLKLSAPAAIRRSASVTAGGMLTQHSVGGSNSQADSYCPAQHDIFCGAPAGIIHQPEHEQRSCGKDSFKRAVSVYEMAVSTLDEESSNRHSSYKASSYTTWTEEDEHSSSSSASSDVLQHSSSVAGCSAEQSSKLAQSSSLAGQLAFWRQQQALLKQQKAGKCYKAASLPSASASSNGGGSSKTTSSRSSSSSKWYLSSSFPPPAAPLSPAAFETGSSNDLGPQGLQSPQSACGIKKQRQFWKHQAAQLLRAQSMQQLQQQPWGWSNRGSVLPETQQLQKRRSRTGYTSISSGCSSDSELCLNDCGAGSTSKQSMEAAAAAITAAYSSCAGFSCAQLSLAQAASAVLARVAVTSGNSNCSRGSSSRASRSGSKMQSACITGKHSSSTSNSLSGIYANSTQDGVAAAASSLMANAAPTTQSQPPMCWSLTGELEAMAAAVLNRRTMSPDTATSANEPAYLVTSAGAANSSSVPHSGAAAASQSLGSRLRLNPHRRATGMVSAAATAATPPHKPPRIASSIQKAHYLPAAAIPAQGGSALSCYSTAATAAWDPLMEVEQLTAAVLQRTAETPAATTQRSGTGASAGDVLGRQLKSNSSNSNRYNTSGGDSQCRDGDVQACRASISKADNDTSSQHKRLRHRQLSAAFAAECNSIAGAADDNSSNFLLLDALSEVEQMAQQILNSARAAAAAATAPQKPAAGKAGPSKVTAAAAAIAATGAHQLARMASRYEKLASSPRRGSSVARKATAASKQQGSSHSSSSSTTTTTTAASISPSGSCAFNPIDEIEAMAARVLAAKAPAAGTAAAVAAAAPPQSDAPKPPSAGAATTTPGLRLSVTGKGCQSGGRKAGSPIRQAASSIALCNACAAGAGSPIWPITTTIGGSRRSSGSSSTCCQYTMCLLCGAACGPVTADSQPLLEGSSSRQPGYSSSSSDGMAAIRSLALSHTDEIAAMAAAIMSGQFQDQCTSSSSASLRPHIVGCGKQQGEADNNSSIDTDGRQGSGSSSDGSGGGISCNTAFAVPFLNGADELAALAAQAQHCKAARLAADSAAKVTAAAARQQVDYTGIADRTNRYLAAAATMSEGGRACKSDTAASLYNQQQRAAAAAEADVSSSTGRDWGKADKVAQLAASLLRRVHQVATTSTNNSSTMHNPVADLASMAVTCASAGAAASGSNNALGSARNAGGSIDQQHDSDTASLGSNSSEAAARENMLNAIACRLEAELQAELSLPSAIAEDSNSPVVLRAMTAVQAADSMPASATNSSTDDRQVILRATTTYQSAVSVGSSAVDDSTTDSGSDTAAETGSGIAAPAPAAAAAAASGDDVVEETNSTAKGDSGSGAWAIGTQPGTPSTAVSLFPSSYSASPPGEVSSAVSVAISAASPALMVPLSYYSSAGSSRHSSGGSSSSNGVGSGGSGRYSNGSSSPRHSSGDNRSEQGQTGSSSSPQLNNSSSSYRQSHDDSSRSIDGSGRLIKGSGRFIDGSSNKGGSSILNAASSSQCSGSSKAHKYGASSNSNDSQGSHRRSHGSSSDEHSSRSSRSSKASNDNSHTSDSGRIGSKCVSKSQTGGTKMQAMPTAAHSSAALQSERAALEHNQHIQWLQQALLEHQQSFRQHPPQQQQLATGVEPSYLLTEVSNVEPSAAQTGECGLMVVASSRQRSVPQPQQQQEQLAKEPLPILRRTDCLPAQERQEVTTLPAVCIAKPVLEIQPAMPLQAGHVMSEPYFLPLKGQYTQVQVMSARPVPSQCGLPVQRTCIADSSAGKGEQLETSSAASDIAASCSSSSRNRSLAGTSAPVASGGPGGSSYCSSNGNVAEHRPKSSIDSTSSGSVVQHTSNLNSSVGSSVPDTPVQSVPPMMTAATGPVLSPAAKGAAAAEAAAAVLHSPAAAIPAAAEAAAASPQLPVTVQTAALQQMSSGPAAAAWPSTSSSSSSGPSPTAAAAAATAAARPLIDTATKSRLAAGGSGIWARFKHTLTGEIGLSESASSRRRNSSLGGTSYGGGLGDAPAVPASVAAAAPMTTAAASVAAATALSATAPAAGTPSFLATAGSQVSHRAANKLCVVPATVTIDSPCTVIDDLDISVGRPGTSAGDPGTSADVPPDLSVNQQQVAADAYPGEALADSLATIMTAAALTPPSAAAAAKPRSSRAAHRCCVVPATLTVNDTTQYRGLPELSPKQQHQQGLAPRAAHKCCVVSATLTIENGHTSDPAAVELSPEQQQVLAAAEGVDWQKLAGMDLKGIQALSADQVLDVVQQLLAEKGPWWMGESALADLGQQVYVAFQLIMMWVEGDREARQHSQDLEDLLGQIDLRCFDKQQLWQARRFPAVDGSTYLRQQLLAVHQERMMQQFVKGGSD